MFDHLRIHTKEKPYCCPVYDCNRKFTQQSNLNKHLDTHNKQSIIVCGHCMKRYTPLVFRNHYEDIRKTKKLAIKNIGLEDLTG